MQPQGMPQQAQQSQQPAPQMPQQAAAPAQGVPQQGATHGDPVSNFYGNLEKLLMPYVQKVPGLEQVISSINQAHLKYLGVGQKPNPKMMPGQ